MITSFDTKIFDLSGQMNAIALNTVDITNSNEKIKVYIPKVMPNIQKGEPTITKLRTNGTTVFKNANRKPAITNQILNEKNYLETNLNAASNINDLNNTSNKLINEINLSIKQLASVNNLQGIKREKTLSYVVNKSNELRVEFLNCKINRLAFTTMDKTKSDNGLK